MQRVPVWRIVIVVLVLLFSLWLLLPTFQFYSIDPLYRNQGMTERLNELQELAADPNNQTDYTEQIRAEQERVEELRAGALRQGMDIRGGVHLVIEIDMEKFVDTLEQQGMGSEEIEYAKETVLFSASEIVENRVDQFGVAEAAIMRRNQTGLFWRCRASATHNEWRIWYRRRHN